MPPTPVSEIIGLILGGLGLFFIGVRLIGNNLRLMAGRGFRMVIAKVTDNQLLSSFVGIIAGGITQSTSAVTFIMTGMISAGLVSTRKAIPMVLWSNVGNCILVFLAVINFHVLILYFLGLVGFLYYCDLDKSRLLRPLVGGLLGITLLFLGLDFMKSGAAPLEQFSWFPTLITHVEESYILGLLIAGALSFLAQSAATVSAIAIALANTGILSLEGTLMIIYGTNLGPGLSTWMLASKLQGSPRQLATFQVIFKLAALSIMVALFYLEFEGGIPLIGSMLQKISPTLSHQLALAYLLFQVIGSTLLQVFTKPIANFLERRYPESQEDQLSKPKYIYDQALAVPDTALQLLKQEQLRVAKRLPAYLDELREDPVVSQDPHTLHRATVALNDELSEYFNALLSNNLQKTTMDRTLNLQNRTELLKNLEENLYELITAPGDHDLTQCTRDFVHSVSEGAHTLLLSAVDILERNDLQDRYLLLRMTEDRSDIIDEIHRQLHEMNPNIGVREHHIIDVVSSRFERIVWMLRYFTKLVEKTYILQDREV